MKVGRFRLSLADAINHLKFIENRDRMQRVSIRSRTGMGGSRGKALTQQKRRAARTSAVANRRMFEQAYRDLYIAPSVPAVFTASGAEIKAIDIASTNYLFRAPATASNIILLNGIQTGAAFYNRVGSRVEMRNLHIRGQVTNAATSTSCMLRLLIVYDRQPTGALPVISDILQSRDQVGTATTGGISEINLDNRDRFAILRDMQYYAPSCTNTAGVLTNGPQFPGQDNQQWDVNEFIKLKSLGTHYKSSTNPSVIADIATGALYACFVATVDATWQAGVGFRLRYDDK